MLAELLLVLSGHPSALFEPYPPAPKLQASLHVSSNLSTHLHPGEITSLNSLGDLSYRYSKIRTWALDTQEKGRRSILHHNLSHSHTRSSRAADVKGKGKSLDSESNDESPSQYITTLAGAVLDSLVEYEMLIVETEARILDMDTALVQDRQGYVPLSSLVATFSKWQAPMASLAHLVDLISSPPASKASTSHANPSSVSVSPMKSWSPGQVIHLVQSRTETGNPHLREIYSSLLKPLRHLFLTHLTAFLLYGLTSLASTATPISPSLGLDVGPDPLSPQHRIYSLNHDLLPDDVGRETRESILYVGRVAATLRREGRKLPTSLTEGLRLTVMDVESLEDGGGLDEAVQKARSDVGEWLWRHILTGPQIADALEAFGNYFLTRNADFSISVIREVTRLRLSKIITSNPHSSSSVIKDHDLNLALLRSSVGTSAETDHFLDHLRFKLEKGPLRPLLLPTSTSNSRRKVVDAQVENPYREQGSIRELFSSFLLGTPLILTTTISWPLDLFMTPPAISAYIDIHTYLLAIRETHLRVLESWTSLSASQRRRRKWTGSTEGGTDNEIVSRRNLARSAWGVVRSMLFFLDQLQSHFMTDIIDVQHRHLINQLDSVSPLPSSTSGSGLSNMGSLRNSTRLGSPSGTRTRVGPGSPRPSSPVSSTHGDAQTVRSRTAIPTPLKSPQNYLDFLTLRQMHARHLSFLREGLLLTESTCTIIIRDILETCKRFAGLVDRWGGDVLPELLMDDAGGGEDEGGNLVHERAEIVKEITQHLHELYSDFFKTLLDSQNPTMPSNPDASAGATSFSRTSRAQFLRQTSFTSASIANRLKTTKNKLDAEKEERNLEAETVMGRHIEQLLLRLDFNGILTDWTTQEEEVEQVTGNILAEGGF